MHFMRSNQLSAFFIKANWSTRSKQENGSTSYWLDAEVDGEKGARGRKAKPTGIRTGTKAAK